MQFLKFYFFCLVLTACDVGTSATTTTNAPEKVVQHTRLNQQSEEIPLQQKQETQAQKTVQQSEVYFNVEELIYGTKYFELISKYPENESNIEFFFGDDLRQESSYFHVDGKKLHAQKVGEEKVTALVFHNDNLMNTVATLLKVLPQPTDDFSYPFFELDSDKQLQSIQPLWKTTAAAEVSYSYKPAVEGLTINEHTGELSFDSLASFAAAGGSDINVFVGGQVAKVTLKIAAIDKTKLKELIHLFINEHGIGATGNYNAIDTSQVSDMSFLFTDRRNKNGDPLEMFNGDISNWQTSNVTNMAYMFLDAYSFNRDIGGWDTSKVRIMHRMFQNAYKFNQDIGHWDISKVKNIAGMFRNALSFNQDIGSWDTSGVEQMFHMFRSAETFNQNIANWDTSKVKNMSLMFYGAIAFNQDISKWNTSKVSNMSYMFSGATTFNQNISDWDVPSASRMISIFDGATAFNRQNSAGNKTQPEAYFVEFKKP